MPPIDDLDLGGGIPMGDGNEPALSDADMDTLMSGGTPNQERVPMGEPPEAEGTEIHETGQKPAEKELPEGAGKDLKTQADPVVQQLQGAISKLTLEQKAALGIQSGPQPVEVVHKGEKLAIPPEKQVPLMQMGLDYSLKMRALNQERQDFETAKAQVTENERYYGEIDKVAKANPEWWQHVQAEYVKFQGKGGNAAGDQPGSQAVSPELRTALSEIANLKAQLTGYLEKSSKEAELKQHQAEDTELDNQITAFSKEHPEFDWMTADDSGLVLADRIVVHAQKHGINNFRAAARDYLFSEIVSRRELKVKESLVDQIRKSTKGGVVKETKKPTGLQPPKNIQSRDYSDLMREGLAELG